MLAQLKTTMAIWSVPLKALVAWMFCTTIDALVFAAVTDARLGVPALLLPFPTVTRTRLCVVMACELNVSVKVDPAAVLNEAVVTNAASVIPFATPDAFAVNCCGVLGSRSAELGDAQRPSRHSAAKMGRNFMGNASFNSGESRGYVRSSVGFACYSRDSNVSRYLASSIVPPILARRLRANLCFGALLVPTTSGMRALPLWMLMRKLIGIAAHLVFVWQPSMPAYIQDCSSPTSPPLRTPFR